MGKVASEMGHQVVSLDISNKYKPDICADIMTIDYKALWPKKSVDVINIMNLHVMWYQMQAQKYGVYIIVIL